MVKGAMFTDDDVKAAAPVCVVGQTVLTMIFGTNEPLGEIVRVRTLPCKVIGVLASKGQSATGQDQDDTILMPYTTVMKKMKGVTWLGSTRPDRGVALRGIECRRCEMEWTSLRSLVAVAAVGVATIALSAAGQPLVLVKTIPLPGVEGRIDHMAVDKGQPRLFVAALGNNSLEVLDLAAGQDVRSVKGLHEPQGIVVIPAPPQVVVANGQGAVEFRAGDAMRVARSVALGEDADNVRYDANAKRVYVGYGSGAIGAIDAIDGRERGSVEVGGHPESFQLEAAGSRIFVNVPTAKQIAVIDRGSMKVVARWPLTEAASNFPMALDEAGHRLFIGCRQPAKVLIVDTSSGKVVSAVDIVGDTDDIFWDAARKRLYVTGGEGFVDVLVPTGESLVRTARIPTAAGARTALFVPEQGRFYVAVPHRGAQNAEIRVYDVKN